MRALETSLRPFVLTSLVVFAVCSPVFVRLAQAETSGRPVGTDDWTPRVWTDFAVEIHVAGPHALEALARALGRERIDREEIEPRPEGILVRTRVDGVTWQTLVASGFGPVRVEDTDRIGREEAEAEGRVRASLGRRAAFTFPLATYPSTTEVGQILGDLAAARPDLAVRYQWGTSIDGRPLWALKVTDLPDSEEAEPEVRLAAGIHGDETVDTILLLNLAHEMITTHGQAGQEELTELVDEFEIHFLPQLNPDGYARGIRYNANYYDLNRNFPEPAGTNSSRQPETLQFMAHAFDHHFVISQSGHGGALVVNYPWDYTYTRAPDDAALIALSLEYSTSNLPMYNGAFPQGITNGADWYVVTGSLQDWSYAQTGCIDLTIEVSNTKWPSASTLPTYWSQNRRSLIDFTRSARHGVNGVVTNAVDGSPVDAVITVAGNPMPVTTDPAVGDYYRLLPTGTFDLTFEADGFEPTTVTDVQTTWGTPTVLDVALQPIGTGTEVPTVASTRIESVTPNPFNPSTEIAYRVARAGRVVIDVVDARGRHVREIASMERAEAGVHRARWDGRDGSGRALGSGVYFVRLRTSEGTSTAKAVLVE